MRSVYQMCDHALVKRARKVQSGYRAITSFHHRIQWADRADAERKSLADPQVGELVVHTAAMTREVEDSHVLRYAEASSISALKIHIGAVLLTGIHVGKLASKNEYFVFPKQFTILSP